MNPGPLLVAAALLAAPGLARGAAAVEASAPTNTGLPAGDPAAPEATAPATPAPPSAAGLPAGDPAPETADPALPEVAPGAPLDGIAAAGPEEPPGLDELAAAREALLREAEEARREIDLLAERRYRERRDDLSSFYDHRLDRLEGQEKADRVAAAEALERFLSRHPSHPRHTPPALLRLAELYYEESMAAASEAMLAYEAALREVEEGRRQEVPPMPAGDYARSIALYRRILAEFPGSPREDTARYLLAYCLELQGEAAEAREGYRALIELHPESRFVPEAWVRLGEHYFSTDEGDPVANLRRAAEAYGTILAYPDHPLYDKALYKLGWTHYRLDEYGPAVDAFVKLVDHYTGREGETGGDLREEALQYTAISFADDTFGGLDRASAYFRALGGRPWEAELYRRIGDLYGDLQKKDPDGTPAAVAAYRLALSRDPLAADAPQIQAKIVAAFSRERRFADEARERDVLVNTYAEGGPWFERHRDDPEVVEAALELTREAVKVAAIFHHAQAQQFKKEERLAEAAVEYATAARGYGEYLRRFPHAKDLYELTYYQAECLFESGDFPGAALLYERIRDFDGEEQYRADAAHAAVLAYQKAMEREVSAGRIPEARALTSKERGDVPPNPRPLPPPMARFVAAADAYGERVPPDENSPAIAFKAAELFYAHDDFEEARRRFEAVILQFPKDPVAQAAANLIIESHLVSKDWARVQEATAALLSRTDLELGAELRGSLTTFQLGAMFQQANELMEAGRHEEAAAEYLELVNEKPDHEFADKALNNAAVCFEKANRFDSAMKTYERIVAEYPRSDFADAALFRVAENARKSYDFDKAVDRYEQLVRDYPDSKERANALNNLAVLLVGLQRYDEGARAHQRFARLFPDDPDAAKNQYRAATVYERKEDWGRLVAALEDFIREFGRDPKQNELVMKAHLQIARAHEKLGRERAARNAYRACVDEFDRRYGGGGAAEPVAAASGAECAFRLAEDEFASWDRLRIEGSRKALERSFERKREAVPRLKERYQDVARYKNVDWTLAAFYRKAYVLERLANALLEAPIPPEVKRLGVEAEDLYRGKIAESVVALEDGAVKEYQETLEQARRFGVANEWTRRTLESLNRFRPKEYPILKEARVELEPRAPLPLGLATLPTGYAAPEGEAAPAGKLGGGAPAAPAAGNLAGGAAAAPAPASSPGTLAPPPPGAAGGIGATGARPPAPRGKLGGTGK